MEAKLSRRVEYTFLDNLKRGRHRWLRLTPAYSARLVAERLQHYSSSTRVLYQSRGHSLQKQARLKPPSLRFPLLAGGTEPVRGSPREAGGT